MKLIVRALVLGVCAAGASAAVFAGQAAPFSSHLSMTATMPTPTCDPGHPCTRTSLMPTPTCDPGHPCTK